MIDFVDYKNSIKLTGEKLYNDKDVRYANGVSIKISALHPRYERNKIEDLEKELLPKLITLCELAKQYNIQLCIDAEENYRLILSLMLLEKLVSHPNLKDWNESLLTLMYNPKLGEKMGKEGRRIVEDKYSVISVLPDVVESIRQTSGKI